MFNPRDHFGDPGSQIWTPAGLGTFFGQHGAPKNMILWKNWSPMGVHGDLCEGIGLYGAQEAFGQAVSPQTQLENNFQGFPQFPKKSLGPPWALGGFPIGL